MIKVAFLYNLLVATFCLGTVVYRIILKTYLFGWWLFPKVKRNRSTGTSGYIFLCASVKADREHRTNVDSLSLRPTTNAQMEEIERRRCTNGPAAVVVCGWVDICNGAQIFQVNENVLKSSLGKMERTNLTWS